MNFLECLFAEPFEGEPAGCQQQERQCQQDTRNSCPAPALDIFDDCEFQNLINMDWDVCLEELPGVSLADQWLLPSDPSDLPCQFPGSGPENSHISLGQADLHSQAKFAEQRQNNYAPESGKDSPSAVQTDIRTPELKCAPPRKRSADTELDMDMLNNTLSIARAQSAPEALLMPSTPFLDNLQTCPGLQASTAKRQLKKSRLGPKSESQKARVVSTKGELASAERPTKLVDSPEPEASWALPLLRTQSQQMTPQSRSGKVELEPFNSLVKSAGGLTLSQLNARIHASSTRARNALRQQACQPGIIVNQVHITTAAFAGNT